MSSISGTRVVGAAVAARGTGALDNRVSALIGALTAAAGAAIAIEVPTIAGTLSAQPGRVGTIAVLTFLLQLFSIRVYERGSVSVSAIGVLAAAFVLDTGTAMAIALLAAILQWLRSRGQLYKAVFDGANFVLSAGAAALTFGALQGAGRFVAALVAGCVYAGINNGSLCLAMSLTEGIAWRTIWLERFHWARYYFVSFGPLALAAAIAYRDVGIAGLVAFALPPALMIVSVRQYLERTTAAVEEIRQVNVRLRRAHRDTIAALSRSMNAKDIYTGGHIDRVAALAVELAKELGFYGEELEAIEIGALLHDIGKIGVPEQILQKAGPLDDSEWDVIKTHPVISDYILSELDLHPFVRQCARSSHERIDGAGYPDGLAGDQIPLPARIILVADAFDAITSSRPYRPTRPILAALAEIEEHAGTQFCPQVVSALRQISRTNPTLLALVQQPQLDAA
jgi:putative nucleotidyltransferase with HDIG domain